MLLLIGIFGGISFKLFQPPLTFKILFIRFRFIFFLYILFPFSLSVYYLLSYYSVIVFFHGLSNFRSEFLGLGSLQHPPPPFSLNIIV